MTILSDAIKASTASMDRDIDALKQMVDALPGILDLNPTKFVNLISNAALESKQHRAGTPQRLAAESVMIAAVYSLKELVQDGTVPMERAVKLLQDKLLAGVSVMEQYSKDMKEKLGVALGEGDAN